MATKFLRHSDEIAHAMSDELYHYGVKGMKWHDHVYADDRKYQSKKGHDYVHDVIDDVFDANFKPIGKPTKPSKVLSKKKTPRWHDPEQHTDPAVIRGEQRLKDSRLHAQVEEKEQYKKYKDEEKRKAMARDEAVRKEEKMRKLSNDAKVRALEQTRAERVGREAALDEQKRQSYRRVYERNNHMSELAKHARANSYHNKMNTKAGIEKARVEQERQARERRNRKR